MEGLICLLRFCNGGARNCAQCRLPVGLSLFDIQRVSASLSLSPRQLGGLLLFACVWLICHPYRGIEGDAILYTTQALRHLYPDIYANDVFFRGESQDNYTLFSPLYAGLIAWLGMGDAAFALSLMGGLLWCYAAWRLSAQWPDARSRGLFLLLLATMPISFGGYGMLSAAELFASPRLWANGLTLLACAWWLERKWLAAGACWLVAMLLHPLMALAGFGFALFHAFRPTRAWFAALLAGTVVALTLAALDVSLFGRLFQIMNPEWFDLVEQRIGLLLLPTRWPLREQSAMVFHLTLLAWAAWLEKGSRLGRMFTAAALVGLAGWAVSLIGGEWLRSVLILQVQPWRMLWLSYVFGWGAVAYLAVRYWPDARMPVLAIALAWLSHENGGALLLWLVLPMWHWRASLRPVYLRVAGVLVVLGLVTETYWTWSEFALTLSGLSEADSRIGWEKLYLWFRQTLPPRGEALLVLFATPMILWAWKKNRSVTLALFLPLALFLLSDWGSRIDAGRTMRPEAYVLQQEGIWGSSPFGGIVPAGTDIYWPDGLELTWLAVGRPSYYSQHQAAGLVFSEEQAREVYRRYQVVRPLGGTNQFFKLLTLEEKLKLMGSAIPAGTLAGMRQVCNAEPKLDYVVLRNQYRPWVKASWYAPFLPGGAHLYSCDSFRIHTTG